jgi:NodT family efflux transporter outer membrane factor (OMF) lipoprotein
MVTCPSCQFTAAENTMPAKCPLAILAISSLSAACAVGPDYARPELVMPEQFMGQAELGQRNATVSADLLAWWEGFDDPQMTYFITQALARNLNLAQAYARVSQARAGLGATTAALLPSGRITGKAARAFQSLETPPGQFLKSTKDYDRYGSLYEANLGANWELDLFGGLRRGHEAALADYRASEAEAVATRLAVAAQTADLYISIRGLQSRLDVARRQVRTQQELLGMLNRLYAMGLVAELQVRQAEGALSQVRATVPALESGLESAMNALDVILGTPPGSHRTELAETRAIPASPQISGMGTPGDLLRRRPDLMVAEHRLAAANARIGGAMAEYYPKVSLSGLIGSATSVADGNLFTNRANQSAGVLGLRWRLFDFGRINAQIDQAKGREAELLADYRLAALQATADVENALSTLVKREEQVTVLTQSVDSLSRARKASFAAYQKGVVSLIEVLRADEGLLSATDARAQALTESARSAVAVFEALGGGWQEGTFAPVAIR